VLFRERYLADKKINTFLVNSAPIMGDENESRGAMASFEDVTELMKKKHELLAMLQVLRDSREEISRQNSELQILATRDTLTGCLNRRSFFGEFETLWQEAHDKGFPLSCLMVDIDHFKSVNDNHGHSKGDEVLKTIASILQASAGQCDVVGRFGGEEFCVVLPRQTIEEARAAGERIRQAIEDADPGGLHTTASLGASAVSLGASDQQQLLDEADKCLYVAKRNGRNQVVCWNDVPADLEVDEGSISRTADPSSDGHESVAIPFHAVTALISALGYRHTDTAEHSRRVADLCVDVGSTMMSAREVYIVEISELLHDIGKIGIPDSILLKPGALTDEEWKVMRDHDRIGVEIVRATFGCPALTAILRGHNAWFGGTPADASYPKGEEIPLGARLLAICDAYDAMVSNRVYRKGMSQEQAFAELWSYAGKQFDPDLVERSIEVMLARDDNRRAEVSNVSSQTALKIGQQIEHLAEALDNHDVEGLGVLAGRLAATAEQSGIEAIASLANEISDAVSNDPELQTLVTLTSDLIELCRGTQSVYLTDVEDYAELRMGK
jgi:diguanylate cyclase (GGDEF)-like protein